MDEKTNGSSNNTHDRVQDRKDSHRKPPAADRIGQLPLPSSLDQKDPLLPRRESLTSSLSSDTKCGGAVQPLGLSHAPSWPLQN